MRIRKRPALLPLSLSQNPDPSFQLPNGSTRYRELHPDGNLPVDLQHSGSTDPVPVPPSDPLPNLIHKQDVKVELDYSSSSSHKTLDVQLPNNESSTAQLSMPKKKKKKKRGVVERNDKSTASNKTGTATDALSNGTSISTSVCDNDEIAIEKKRRRRRRSPAVLLEGSSCSRVNGKGWRCNQQTLVGYALCEHHLGKGRLRSVSNVQVGVQVMSSSSTSNPRKKDSYNEAADIEGKQRQQQQEQEEFWGFGNGEKIGRQKVGMVKARSMSRLLDEIDQYPGAAVVQSPLRLPDS